MASYSRTTPHLKLPLYDYEAIKDDEYYLRQQTDRVTKQTPHEGDNELDKFNVHKMTTSDKEKNQPSIQEGRKNSRSPNWRGYVPLWRDQVVMCISVSSLATLALATLFLTGKLDALSCSCTVSGSETAGVSYVLVHICFSLCQPIRAN